MLASLKRIILLNSDLTNRILSLHKRIETRIPQTCFSTDYIKSMDNKMYVQRHPEDEMMTISFCYGPKQFNLNRNKTELLASCISRIKCSLLKTTKKSRQERNSGAIKEASEPTFHVALSVKGEAVDPSVVNNIEAWVDGATVDLNGVYYEVRTDCPGVKSLTLPSHIMVGYDTIANVSVINCNLEDCKFAWYRQISAQERKDLVESKGVREDEFESSYTKIWYKVSSNLIYCARDEDLAHNLKVVCVPSDGNKTGLPSVCYSKGPVELGPKICPFEKRHLFTEEVLSRPEMFRVVCYNILADLYADTDSGRKDFFPHCPPHYLDIDYRKHLLIKEISGYNADIVCLQEVDKKEFSSTFEPFFRHFKMLGIHNNKGYRTPEGVATFFRDDKFELVQSHRILLSELIEEYKPRPEGMLDEEEEEEETKETSQVKNDVVSEISRCPVDLQPHFILSNRDSEECKILLAKFNKIRAAILANPQLKKRFLGLHTILQISLLKFKNLPQNYLVVANTHLYFAPDSDHIRLLQGSVCVKYIEYIKNYYEEFLLKPVSLDNSKPLVNVIFCGDMNSDPGCGLRKLVLEGSINEDLKDWSSNKEEEVIGLSVETDLRFSSAYENVEYTNYTPGFNGCLDYIYYQRDEITCESTVPLPDHDVVTAMEGLPSDVFPSDHLALIADLKSVN